MIKTDIFQWEFYSFPQNVPGRISWDKAVSVRITRGIMAPVGIRWDIVVSEKTFHLLRIGHRHILPETAVRPPLLQSLLRHSRCADNTLYASHSHCTCTRSMAYRLTLIIACVCVFKGESCVQCVCWMLYILKLILELYRLEREREEVMQPYQPWNYQHCHSSGDHKVCRCSQKYSVV